LSDRTAQDRIAHLEARVVADPGAEEFPSLAEALRRAGRLVEAEAVVRRGLERKPGSLDGTLVLALALLDLGRVEAARGALAEFASERFSEHRLPQAEVLDSVPAFTADPTDGFDDDVTDGELESAFDAAEPVLDELVDANRVAELAMRDAELDAPEDLASDPIFATRAMAELLERQGDTQAASRIRTKLDADASAEAVRLGGSSALDERERTIATLESWLANLRSGMQ
jgi:predicted Zn-dependent protease